MSGIAALRARLLRLPRNVLAIGLVSLLNDASSEFIYPVLPLFLTLTLGASPFAVGVIEGGAESLSGFLKLFSGYFSDRRGRRKALVVSGYGLAMTGAILLITDFLFGTVAAIPVGAAAALLFGSLWYYLPLSRSGVMRRRQPGHRVTPALHLLTAVPQVQRRCRRNKQRSRLP